MITQSEIKYSYLNFYKLKCKYLNFLNYKQGLFNSKNVV